MLMSIPVISPVDVRLGEAVSGAAFPLLPSGEPDYTVQPLEHAPALAALPGADPVRTALDDLERAARTSEYHDFEWWDERLRILRTALGR